MCCAFYTGVIIPCAGAYAFCTGVTFFDLCGEKWRYAWKGSRGRQKFLCGRSYMITSFQIEMFLCRAGASSPHAGERQENSPAAGLWAGMHIPFVEPEILGQAFPALKELLVFSYGFTFEGNLVHLLLRMICGWWRRRGTTELSLSWS